MNPFCNASSPHGRICVQGDDVHAIRVLGDLVESFKACLVVDACDVDMDKQGAFQLFGFAFFCAVWIDESLHSFECGALQSPVGLAIKVFKQLCCEGVMERTDQLSDQMCFP